MITNEVWAKLEHKYGTKYHKEIKDLRDKGLTEWGINDILKIIIRMKKKEVEK